MSHIAIRWRRLPYYAQFFGSAAVMTAAILLTIAIHSLSGGRTSRVLNFFICLGSFFLGWIAFPNTDNAKETDLRYGSWYFLLAEHAMIILILFICRWDISEVPYFLNKVGKMRTLMILATQPTVSAVLFIAAEVAKYKKKRWLLETGCHHAPGHFFTFLEQGKSRQFAVLLHESRLTHSRMPPLAVYRHLFQH